MIELRSVLRKAFERLRVAYSPAWARLTVLVNAGHNVLLRCWVTQLD